MRRALIYILGRYCEARADRALQRYFVLRERAEKFFRRLDRGGHD